MTPPESRMSSVTGKRLTCNTWGIYCFNPGQLLLYCRDLSHELVCLQVWLHDSGFDLS